MTTTKSNERFATKAIKVEQNDRIFYLAAIPVEVLFGCCFIDRHEDNEKGYQRKLEEPRAEKIATYLAQPGNSIPGNIVLSATSEADVTFDEEYGEMSFSRCKGAFACMDGQHRLWGYKKRGGLTVPVTIYVELDSISEARMFIDVNEEQKGVPKALLLQIKSLANMESEREKELRTLFEQFQKDERSPIRDMLHMSGRKQGLINRASFDYAVGRAQRSESFSQLPAAKRFSILSEYVRAFSEALEDKTKLGRRYYFAAMFDAFDEVLRWTKSKYGSIAKSNLAASIKKIANVSGGTQTALATAMRAGLNDVSLSDDDSAEY
jgi:DNA sulfur modification protein DndB